VHGGPRASHRGLGPARRLGPLAVAAALGVAATGCVGPARTDPSYRSKAWTTVDQVHGAVETALLVIDGAHRHGLPSAFVSVAIADAEQDAVAAQETFESIQPPSQASDRVRERTTSAVDEAVTDLTALRIGTRRGEVDRLAPVAEELRSQARALQALSDALHEGR
jgi:hypothetical protein